MGYVAQIHEFKGRQQLYLEQNPAALDRLVDGGFLVRHGRGRAAFYTRADAK